MAHLLLAVLAALSFPAVVGAATLAWDPSQSPDVAGYELHVGYAPGAYEYSIDVGASTNARLPALAAGRTHFLAVTAYGFTGGRSAYSNEVVIAAAEVDAQPLSASFTAFPSVGVAPHTVRFTPSVSGALLWYRWDFGDGNVFVSDSVTPLPDVAHAYDFPGTYSVTLTVAGPVGLQQSHRTPAVIVVSADAADGCPCSFWDSGSPRLADDASQAPINVGMRFAASRDGYVTAIRFYKSPANLGPHVGDLWTGQGEHLGSATFANETVSGWQQADLATPIRIQAHAVYAVSYHAPLATSPGTTAHFSSASSPARCTPPRAGRACPTESTASARRAPFRATPTSRATTGWTSCSSPATETVRGIRPAPALPATLRSAA